MRFNSSVLFVIGAAALTSLATTTAHAQTTFNFDTKAGGAATTPGATINSQYPGAGVTFSSNAVIQSSGGGVTSLPNFASTPDFLGSLSAVFDGTVDFVSAQNVTNSSFTLSAFDINNVLLGTTFVSGYSGVNPGNSGPGYVFLSSPGLIKSVTFSTTGQFGFDDFRFSPSAVTAVPEPSEWLAMGMAGASVCGLMLRARRRKAGKSGISAAAA